MVQIVGKYQFVSAENIEHYVKSLGKPELEDLFITFTPTAEIQQNGDQWIVTVTSKGISGSVTFKFGEAYEEQLLSIKLKNITTGDGNSFRTETSLSTDLKMVRVHEFTDDGIVEYLSNNKNDIKAKRIFKRQ